GDVALQHESEKWATTSNSFPDRLDGEIHPSVTKSGLRVCVLGSGSGGNSTLVTLGQHAMLLDAGFGPNTTRTRLLSARFNLNNIQAICVTHFDTDHFRPTWIRTMVQRRIRLFVHEWHADELYRLVGGTRLLDADLVTVFGREPFTP